jgi:hypothetical protein
LSLSFLRPEYTVSAAAAKGSDDDTVRFYFQGGYAF